MKLVMTLLVRDEQDIIRENIEFHLSQGVDFIIAMDNRSVDATAKILKYYEAKGKLLYIFEKEDNYNQHAWVTRMARMAFTDYGADWVINNDADEFWWPGEGSLRTVFSQLPLSVNLVRAKRHNFAAVEESAEPFWSRMIFREKISLNPLGGPLPPKVAHRGSARVEVMQGNHTVKGIEDPLCADDLVEILHFPVRSYAQIENKIAKGGAAYERNTDLPRSAGRTWRELFEELKRDQNLNRYFHANLCDGRRLAEKLRLGELIVDRRLADAMVEIFARP